MTYHNAMTQLMPEDRFEAMQVIEDDEEFDAWLKRYELKMQSKPSKRPSRPGRVAVSKDEFLERMGSVHG